MRRTLALYFALVSCSQSPSPSQQAATVLSDNDVRSLLRAGISVPAAASDISVACAANTQAVPSVRRKIDATLARTLHTDCMRTSRFPITDNELADLTRLHWREVDVGERVSVVHVVAKRAKMTEKDAHHVLERLRNDLKSATDLNSFGDVALLPVNASKGDLVLEPLAMFTADGRATEGPPTTFDGQFVRAAFALTPDAPLSPISESAFGWHLIFLLTRLPAKHLAEANTERINVGSGGRLVALP